jgi:hypothetical protein
MRPLTRSVKCYEDAVLSPGLRGYKPKVVCSKGMATDVWFNRKTVNETECFIEIPVPKRARELAAMRSAWKQKAPVNVVAVDGETAYKRGKFKVVQANSRMFTLEKCWPCVPRASVKVAVEVPPPSPIMLPAPSVPPATPPANDDEFCFFPPQSTVTAPKTTVYKRPTTSTPLPKAVKTSFNGIEYRSRLESRFAQLLEACGIRFVYEPVKYNLESKTGCYTIDFFLPAQQLYVEVKPKRPHLEEEQKCEEMSRAGFRVALMYGSAVHKPPFRSEFFQGRSHRDYAHHDAMRGMVWIDGKKLPGDTVFVCGPPPTAACATPLDLVGDGVHLNQVQTVMDTRWSHPRILGALKSLYSS